jgi:hypothetical protein
MSIEVNATEQIISVNATGSTIDINVASQTVDVNATTSVIEVTASYNPGINLPNGGTTGQVLKKQSNTDYDTYWAADEKGVPYIGATGDVDLGEYEIKAGQFELDQSPTGTAGVAVTRWNNTIGSTETTLKGGSVVLKNGVDLIARVVNKVTPNTTLTKAAYQAVRISGAQGQRLAVALAQANNDNNSADTIGLVTETIATNQEGFIMTVGNLEGINTTGSLQGETWTDGDVLYLSPTIAGVITNVKPVAPQHLVIIGYVEYAHANNGKIYVKTMNGYELGELHDVNTTGATNGQVLKYNGSIWTPQNDLNTGTVTSVDLSAPTGFVVTGNPITSSGTLALSFASGYSLPTTVKQGNWDDAYTFTSSFPSQTGNNGKYLTTDGSTLSWGTVSTANIYNSDGTLTGNRTVTMGSNNLLFTGTGTTRFTGNLTIGNNTISNYQLNIFGDTFSYITLNNTASGTGTQQGFQIGLESSGDVYFLNRQAGFIQFRTANADRMRLTSAGRLLLGTTTESTYILDVNGTARVSNTFTVTKGASNYITLEASANATSPFIDIFYSGNSQARIYPSVGRAVGTLTLSQGVSINQNSTTIDAGLYASNIGILNGQLGITNTSGNSLIHLNTSAGFSTFISFRETAVADKGVIGFSNGGTYFQIRTNGATSLTTGTLSTIFDNVGSVGIGGITSVNTSAILQVDSTTKGFLPPRMTTAQRDLIGTPATGLTVYNTTLNTNDFYNGTAWVSQAAGNIYTADGTLTAARTLTSGGFPLTFTGSNTAATAIARGLNLTHTLVAAANNDVLVGLDINPTFINGAFTGVANAHIRALGTNSNTIINNNSVNITDTRGSTNTPSLSFITTTTNTGIIVGNSTYPYAAGANSFNIYHAVSGPIAFYNGGSNPTRRFSILSDGKTVVGSQTTATKTFEVNASTNTDGIQLNATVGLSNTSITINHTSAGANIWGINSAATGSSQTAGTLAIGSTNNNLLLFATGNTVLGAANSSDAGYKLDVNGTARVSGAATFNGAINAIGGGGGAAIFVGNGEAIRGNATSGGSMYLDASRNLTGTIFVRATDLDLSGITNAISAGSLLLTGIGQTLRIANTGAIRGAAASNGALYIDASQNLTSGEVNFRTGTINVSGSGTITTQSSSILTLDSTTKGFLPPRMTETQKNAISTPATGLVIYQTDGTEGLYERTSTAWRILYNTPSGGSGITRSVSNISTTQTAGATASTDYVYLISGTTTLTLPTAVGNTNRYTLKNVGTNTVTINTTSSQTIDGSTSITMAVQYTALDVISDGTNWNII